ncbi:uncharacterized protein LOC116294259 [Actinia tenebrosa]|uniref:Uncharacterized protein LOC116294259 n=1 Tax=Actinia tenebrosa TaxID=6105 RepID=A0A6P8HRE6_ACTTE|nr:uncharacterized protein LOC116294259 [Actinia tenebrosa]
MELKDDDGTSDGEKRLSLTRERLLHKRSKTFHSLPSRSNTKSKRTVKADSSELENVVRFERTRPSSCVTVDYESKQRLRTSSIPLLRPKTVSLTGKFNKNGKNHFQVLGTEISFGKNSKQNNEENKEFYSSFYGRRSRRRTNSAASNRSRNPSLGSSTEVLSARSRSGSKTALSRIPGLIKLNSSCDMKDFSEVEYDDDDEERRKKLRERFRHAVRLVSIFSVFCIGIRKYAEQEKSGEYDMYYLRDMLPDNEDKPTPVQESSLYFNKHLFSRDNTLHFPFWARWICAQDPSDRTDAEINKLVTLLRGIKSFNKFSREAQWHLCRTMTYEIALMTEDACRTATIICRERVEVLVVNRETVMEHCPDVFQKEFQEKMSILKSHDLFQRWDEKPLKQLCFESHIKELAHGKLVDPDSTASDAVQFILRGKIDMLRRLDLSAVLASKASISLCKKLPLPRPTSAIPRKGKSGVEYVSVGSLYKNDAWDLRTVFPNVFKEPGNILVSAGVRLLKVPKQRIIQLSPAGALEEFECNFVQNHRCPSDDELYQEYLSAQAWLEYRQKVVKNVIDCKHGHFIAHASCLSKGTSGWGAWPGKEIKAQEPKEDKDHDES